MEYTFTTANFTEEVINSDIPVMVDFYADWCGPCQMMMPVVAELAQEYEGKIKIGRINTDENMDIAEKYSIISIPNFIFFKDGKPVDSSVGAVPKDVLKEKLDAMLFMK